MIAFALNSFSSASKSSQTLRVISSQRVSISSSNTPRRYFVTKTKCTCNCRNCMSATSVIVLPIHETNRRRILGVQLRYNYRAYPDAAQRRALASAFGCARVVWNDCLRDRRQAHASGLPYVKSAELSRLRITQAKRTEERAWLADVSAVVLQQSLRDLDTAYSEAGSPRKGRTTQAGIPGL